MAYELTPEHRLYPEYKGSHKEFSEFISARAWHSSSTDMAIVCLKM